MDCEMKMDGCSGTDRQQRIAKNEARSADRRRLHGRAASADLALALPALAEQHEQHVVARWQRLDAGEHRPAEQREALQVTRFVGSVRVVTGAKSGSYLLRLHSQEPLEKDARRQFANFHLGVGRRSGEVLIQTVGPVDLAVRRRTDRFSFRRARKRCTSIPWPARSPSRER